MKESVAVKEVSKPGETSRGKQATAGGWSHCHPQAAGLGGKPWEVLPLTHSSADAPDRWMIEDWIHNGQGGPGAGEAKEDAGLG